MPHLEGGSAASARRFLDANERTRRRSAGSRYIDVRIPARELERLDAAIAELKAAGVRGLNRSRVIRRALALWHDAI